MDGTKQGEYPALFRRTLVIEPDSSSPASFLFISSTEMTAHDCWTNNKILLDKFLPVLLIRFHRSCGSSCIEASIKYI